MRIYAKDITIVQEQEQKKWFVTLNITGVGSTRKLAICDACSTLDANINFLLQMLSDEED
jgi:hypothetical protein